MTTRRQFLAASAALTAASLLPAADAKKPKLRKAVKFSMIGAGKTVRDKFELVKKLGFEGVEMDSPSSVNRYAAVKAHYNRLLRPH